MVHSLDFSKKYESLDDYNFLSWGAPMGYALDIVKSVIPNYEEMDKGVVNIAYRAVVKAIMELKDADRILITQREYDEWDRLKELQNNQKENLNALEKEYGDASIARVLMANVLTLYSNHGNKRSDGYEVAKQWCIEQGMFSDIEYRAMNGLPSRKNE